MGWHIDEHKFFFSNFASCSSPAIAESTRADCFEIFWLLVIIIDSHHGLLPSTTLVFRLSRTDQTTAGVTSASWPFSLLAFVKPKAHWQLKTKFRDPSAAKPVKLIKYFQKFSCYTSCFVSGSSFYCSLKKVRCCSESSSRTCHTSTSCCAFLDGTQKIKVGLFAVDMEWKLKSQQRPCCKAHKILRI